MDSWHATLLGRGHLPREVTAFEVEVFFQFSAEEARIIEERRRPELKLGLASQIGFLRMSAMPATKCSWPDCQFEFLNRTGSGKKRRAPRRLGRPRRTLQCGCCTTLRRRA